MLVFSRCSVSQDRLYEDRDSYNGSTDTPKRRNTGIPGNVKNPTGFSRVEYVSIMYVKFSHLGYSVLIKRDEKTH